MMYTLISALALALFYLFYKWLLSRDTLHRFNRFVLLASLLLTATLPLLHMDFGRLADDVAIAIQEVVVTPANGYDMQSMPVRDDVQLLDVLTWSDHLPSTMLLGVIFVGYLLVAGVLLLVFLYKLTGLIEQCHGSKTERLDDGCHLLLHDRDYAPFSWMRTIVVSHKDYEANGPMILAHEREHVHLGHSWDLLLAQLCCCVQWFNPAAWLVKKELQAVHEYEADEAMLRSGCNATQYQMKLIETALGARFSSIANNFTNVSTKKRILMMMKKETSPWARAKVLYMIPVAMLVLFATSCKYQPKAEETQEEATIAESDAPAAASVTVNGYKADAPKDDSEIFMFCEELPEFSGGMVALMEYLQKSLKYPESAMKEGTQGRVIVQFVVEKDGSVSNVEVVRSVSAVLDAEAVRVVSAMPAWTPGKQRGEVVRTKFTLPVTFRLND